MTKKQEELAEQHGTPEQFEKAIWEAYADLFITRTEAWAAIRNSPTYGYAKAIRVLSAKTGKNINTFKIVECEHSVGKNDKYGFIRLFRPCDMIKDT